MNNAHIMSGGDASESRQDEIQRLVDREGATTRDEFGQVEAVKKLHGEVRGSALGAPRQDPDDVWMLNACGREAFA